MMQGQQQPAPMQYYVHGSQHRHVFPYADTGGVPAVGPALPPHAFYAPPPMSGQTTSQLLPQSNDIGDMHMHVVMTQATPMGDLKWQEEKKRLKRAANRKSASTSRARKKALVEEMTMQNMRLKKHAEILSLLPDLILALLRSGEVSYASEACERFLQHPIDLVKGANMFDLVTPECHDTLRELISETLSRGATAVAQAQQQQLGIGGGMSGGSGNGSFQPTPMYHQPGTIGGGPYVPPPQYSQPQYQSAGLPQYLQRQLSLGGGSSSGCTTSSASSGSCSVSSLSSHKHKGVVASVVATPARMVVKDDETLPLQPPLQCPLPAPAPSALPTPTPSLGQCPPPTQPAAAAAAQHGGSGSGAAGSQQQQYSTLASVPAPPPFDCGPPADAPCISMAPGSLQSPSTDGSLGTSNSGGSSGGGSSGGSSSSHGGGHSSKAKTLHKHRERERERSREHERDKRANRHRRVAGAVNYKLCLIRRDKSTVWCDVRTAVRMVPSDSPFLAGGGSGGGASGDSGGSDTSSVSGLAGPSGGSGIGLGLDEVVMVPVELVMSLRPMSEGAKVGPALGLQTAAGGALLEVNAERGGAGVAMDIGSESSHNSGADAEEEEEEEDGYCEEDDSTNSGNDSSNGSSHDTFSGVGGKSATLKKHKLNKKRKHDDRSDSGGSSNGDSNGSSSRGYSMNGCTTQEDNSNGSRSTSSGDNGSSSGDNGSSNGDSGSNNGDSGSNNGDAAGIEGGATDNSGGSADGDGSGSDEPVGESGSILPTSDDVQNAVESLMLFSKGGLPLPACGSSSSSSSGKMSSSASSKLSANSSSSSSCGGNSKVLASPPKGKSKLRGGSGGSSSSSGPGSDDAGAAPGKGTSGGGGETA